MGITQCNLAHLYSVEVSPPLPDCCPPSTGCIRAATHPDSLVANFGDCPVDNCYGIFLRGKRVSNDGPCVGFRPKAENGDLALDYKFCKYSEIEDIGRRIGSYLLDIDGIPYRDFPQESLPAARRLRAVGIFSKTRFEWFTVEMACNYYGAVIVPIYDTLGKEATKHILEQTQLATVVCGGEVIDVLTEVLSETDAPHFVQHVVALDPLTDEQVSKFKLLNVQVHKYRDLAEYHKKHETSCNPGLDDVYTICYTSGTTGQPKGVIITQGNIVANVAGVIRGPLQWSEMRVGPGDIHMSYLPLAHVFERAITNVAYGSGAAIGVYSGDTHKLLDDIRVLMPTIFCSVPRLFNKINDRVFASVKGKNAVQQMLFNTAVNAKLTNVRKNGSVSHGLWDAIVFNKVRRLMGGKLSFMLVGGAPIEAEVQDNIKILFSCYLSEGFGMTETLGTSFLAHPKDPVSGHVGGPIPCVECRIQSVPEMDYYVTDKPHPRGELCIRGPAVSPGYFLHAGKGKSDDGWLHSGDIVALLETGAVKIIDRRKNMFKLAQGEYIAPERIEGTYAQASLISQIFVTGYSNKFYVVAVVVPDEDAARKWAEKNAVADSLQKVCKMPEFKQSILSEMAAIGKKLKGFERVKDIFVTDEPFGDNNGMMTPTFKLKRHVAAKRFEKEIRAMYPD